MGLIGTDPKSPIRVVMKAKIAEIFESIQGEGLYAGQKQVFIRFFGCNLSCVFCDTHLSGFKDYSIQELKDVLAGYSGYHSLSLTGGEPLCQADFLWDFLNGYEDKPIVYLETNGTLTDELSRIIDHVDIIAMDFKLPSSSQARAFWKEHEDFLKIALSKKVFVKIVITKASDSQEIRVAGDIIKRVKTDMDVVLQPHWFDIDSALLTKMGPFKEELISSGIPRVRILPQAHKYAGIR